jgi:hypothetical protein
MSGRNFQSSGTCCAAPTIKRWCTQAKRTNRDLRVRADRAECMVDEDSNRGRKTYAPDRMPFGSSSGEPRSHKAIA